MTATDDAVDNVVKQWFRFAKDRDGGRDVRRQQHSSN